MVDWSQPVDGVGFDDMELTADYVEKKLPPSVSPDKFKDRLLVLARTDGESRSIPLPTGRMGSEGELFAAALATAETGAFANRAGRWGDGLVLLLGLGLAWAMSMQRKLMVFPLAVGFGAAYLLACLAVFESTRIALPLTPMLGLAAYVAVYRLLAPGGKVEG